MLSVTAFFPYFRHTLYFVGPNQVCAKPAFLFGLVDLHKNNIKSIDILSKCSVLIIVDEAIIFLFSDLRENFQNVGVGGRGVEIKIKIKTQK